MSAYFYDIHLVFQMGKQVLGSFIRGKIQHFKGESQFLGILQALLFLWYNLAEFNGVRSGEESGLYELKYVGFPVLFSQAYL